MNQNAGAGHVTLLALRTPTSTAILRTSMDDDEPSIGLTPLVKEAAFALSLANRGYVPKSGRITPEGESRVLRGKPTSGKPTWGRPETAGPPMIQVLDPSGRAAQDIGLAREDLVRLHRWMVLGRVFDERAFALQRQGRIGTYGPFAGQEAAIVGSAAALQPQDWIFPTYREVLAGMMHGVPMSRYLLLFRGHARGGATPEEVNVFPIQISVGTHIPHAVGAAWGARLLGHDTVVLAYFGDGATSKGDFHEALNFAGVFNVPAVLICLNNHWAISVPRAVQTASETLAQKAIAYGFEGVQVDGMDVLATYQVTRAAVDKARRGGGPTLIEAVCYRFGPHTTADDPTRYREEGEVAKWRALDPLPRMRAYLTAQGAWDDAAEATLWEEARGHVARALDAAESEPASDPGALFEHAYATPSALILEQRQSLRADG